MKIMPGDLLLYHPWSSIAKVRNNPIPEIVEIFSSFLGNEDTDLDQEDNAGKPQSEMEEDETFSWLDFHPRGLKLPAYYIIG